MPAACQGALCRAYLGMLGDHAQTRSWLHGSSCLLASCTHGGPDVCPLNFNDIHKDVLGLDTRML